MSLAWLRNGTQRMDRACRAPRAASAANALRGRGIVEQHAVLRADDIMDDRLGQRRRGHGLFCQTHDDGVATGRGFRRDAQLVAARQEQQPPLSTGVLDRRAHERVEQFLQDDLARHGLRDFEHGREVQVFDRRPDRARRRSAGLFRPQVRIELHRAADLAISAPAEIAVTGIAQIRMRNGLEAACGVEARRKLVGERFVVHEAVCARRTDRLFVQAFGVQLPAFDASDLRADQRGAVCEILRAVLRPCHQLSVVGGQRLDMLPVLRGERGIAGGRVAERPIEMRFRRLKVRWRRPQQALRGH